ncbi:hypothetical protein [Methylotenera sp.]|nr:hypothetical protein [Methylotenera sp.]
MQQRQSLVAKLQQSDQQTQELTNSNEPKIAEVFGATSLKTPAFHNKPKV